MGGWSRESQGGVAGKWLTGPSSDLAGAARMVHNNVTAKAIRIPASRKGFLGIWGAVSGNRRGG